MHMIGIDFIFENAKLEHLPLIKIMISQAYDHYDLSQAIWALDSYDDVLVLEARHPPVLVPGIVVLPILHIAARKARSIIANFNAIYAANVWCTNVELDFAPQMPAPHTAGSHKDVQDV